MLCILWFHVRPSRRTCSFCMPDAINLAPQLLVFGQRLLNVVLFGPKFVWLYLSWTVVGTASQICQVVHFDFFCRLQYSGPLRILTLNDKDQMCINVANRCAAIAALNLKFLHLCVCVCYALCLFAWRKLVRLLDLTSLSWFRWHFGVHFFFAPLFVSYLLNIA